MSTTVRSIVAMAHVADVGRSIAFYRHFGFEVGNSFTPPGGPLSWAWLKSGSANLMVTRADAPIDPAQQAVLFYLYVDDLSAMKAALGEAGIEAGEVRYPFYAPKGEFRTEDPDGYVLMVMQSD